MNWKQDSCWNPKIVDEIKLGSSKLLWWHICCHLRISRLLLSSFHYVPIVIVITEAFTWHLDGKFVLHSAGQERFTEYERKRNCTQSSSLALIMMRFFSIVAWSVNLKIFISPYFHYMHFLVQKRFINLH